MCSSYDYLSANEINIYIKKLGLLKDPIEPCIYIPDIQASGYKYGENESGPVSVPFGINENDKQILHNTEFILINDSETNAISTSIKDIPIIGLYLGSISEIDYNANIMVGSLFEENFPADSFIHKKIFIDDKGVLVVRNDNNLLGYKDERIISYLITETALRFLILHEIGHHYRGHIVKLLDKQKRFFLRANDDTYSDFEIEADSFAAQGLAREFPLVLQEFANHKEDMSEFCIEDIELMALNTMITALTLPFSILYQPFKDKGNGIESTIAYRELLALMTLATELYDNSVCQRAAVYDLCNKTKDDLEEIKELTNNTINIKRIKETQTISFFEFGQYMMLMFTDSKRLYYRVNKIENIDAYLDDYTQALSFLSGQE